MKFLLVCFVFASISYEVSSASDDSRTLTPWVVSIFHRPSDSGSWEYICSGTITGPSTVITSARCVIPKVTRGKTSSRPYHMRYQNLQVVAALSNSELSSKDQFTQILEVGQIRDLLSEDFDTPESDLAALRLKEEFNFTTPYVKSVKVTEVADSFIEAYITKPGDSVFVAGFDNTRGVKTRSQSALQSHTLLLTDISTCLEHYRIYTSLNRFTILCAKSLKDSVLPCNFQGAGIIAKSNETDGENYLIGVYSSNTAAAKLEGQKDIVTVPSATCTKDDIAFIPKLGRLGRWAISHYFCDNDLMMCKNDRCRPLKDLCSGKAECDDESDEFEKNCFNQKAK